MSSHDGQASKCSAIASIESQLATVDRLRERSVRTADRLRLTRTRLDELAAVEGAALRAGTGRYPVVLVPGARFMPPRSAERLAELVRPGEALDVRLLQLR